MTLSENAEDKPAEVIAAGSANVGTEPHDKTEDIIRQVEYYFGEENLPTDAYLLACAGGDGNGPVSIDEVLKFPKMKRFKPRDRVIASLMQSKSLEVINQKFVKRSGPLKTPLAVSPSLLAPRLANPKPTTAKESQLRKTLEEKPWLTKAMLKPTGFELHYSDGPIRPEEHVEERKLFDPRKAFSVRIETAVNMYASKRKWHALHYKVFTKFLHFGGFDQNYRQFSGGLAEHMKDEYTKAEIAQLNPHFVLSRLVLEELDEDDQTNSLWKIDFATMAKAFLSSPFMDLFEWRDEKTVHVASIVLHKFYNYLLYHDVCPEYREQLLAAGEVCALAEKELPKLAKIDQLMPGAFNTACSTLFGGHFAGLHRQVKPEESWTQIGENLGWSLEDAQAVFTTSTDFYGSEYPKHLLKDSPVLGSPLSNMAEEILGIEVVGVELPSETARSHYTNASRQTPLIRPMGKLHCIRWDPPHTSPLDLPAAIANARAAQKNEKLVFLLDEEILLHCYPGIKMEAVVKLHDPEIMWIDCVEAVYPSFFTWTANERIREWKKVGPPTKWMQRIERDEAAAGDNFNEDEDNCD